MNGYWKLCLPVLLLGATALPALAVQSAPTEHQQHAAEIAYQHWQKTAIETLTARSDADSLYTSALLMVSPVANSGDSAHKLSNDKQHALELLDQAASLQPDAADIAAQALLMCSEVAGCDVAIYADRYRNAAPNDARVWLPALHAARKQHEQATVTNIIQSMGAAHHFGSYWVATRARARRGLTHVLMEGLTPQVNGLNPDTLAMVRGIYAAVLASPTALSAYDDLTRTCKPTVAAFAQRRSACRNIGLLLENDGSSMVDTRIGLWLHRQAANSDADYAEAVASGRRIDWQSQLYYTTLAYQQPSDAVDAEPTPKQINEIAAISKRRATAIREHGGEAAGIEALLAQAGLPLEPPADWVDKHQQWRLADDRKIRKEAASQSTKK